MKIIIIWNESTIACGPIISHHRWPAANAGFETKAVVTLSFLLNLPLIFGKQEMLYDRERYSILRH
jgi:hypothetical protein